MNRSRRSRTDKIAISMPSELARKIDAYREARSQTRSGFVREAIVEYIAKQDIEEKERRYAEGYRRMPETEEEIAETEALLELGPEMGAWDEA